MIDRTSRTIRYIVLMAAWSACCVNAVRSGCDEATTTRELEACLKTELEAVAMDIERLQAEVQQGTTVAQRSQLRSAHAAWEKYMDANCQSVTALFEGGSVRGVLLIECELRMTTGRAAEIRGILEQLNPSNDSGDNPRRKGVPEAS